MVGGGPLAPTVLTRVPCPGEIPQVPVASTASIGPAFVAPAEIAPPVCRELLPATDDGAGIEPNPFRLDRPPR